MKLTTLFRLRKPDGTDPVNIEDFNDNFDVIDEELGKRLESTGNASDMTAAFTQASTRTNLKTGEKISASFGKIMKWFADLKTVAFSGSYSDLSNKPSIPCPGERLVPILPPWLCSYLPPPGWPLPPKE